VDLWAENQKGELVMKGECILQLFFSLEDENRQRAGQPPIVVNVPRESLTPPGGIAAEAAKAGKKPAKAAGRKVAPTKSAKSAKAKKPSKPAKKKKK
jgi:hypothetical protein